MDLRWRDCIIIYFCLGFCIAASVTRNFSDEALWRSACARTCREVKRLTDAVFVTIFHFILLLVAMLQIDVVFSGACRVVFWFALLSASVKNFQIYFWTKHKH